MTLINSEDLHYRAKVIPELTQLHEMPWNMTTTSEEYCRSPEPVKHFRDTEGNLWSLLGKPPESVRKPPEIVIKPLKLVRNPLELPVAYAYLPATSVRNPKEPAKDFYVERNFNSSHFIVTLPYMGKEFIDHRFMIYFKFF